MKKLLYSLYFLLLWQKNISAKNDELEKITEDIRQKNIEYIENKKGVDPQSKKKIIEEINQRAQKISKFEEDKGVVPSIVEKQLNVEEIMRGLNKNFLAKNIYYNEYSLQKSDIQIDILKYYIDAKEFIKVKLGETYPHIGKIIEEANKLSKAINYFPEKIFFGSLGIISAYYAYKSLYFLINKMQAMKKKVSKMNKVKKNLTDIAKTLFFISSFFYNKHKFFDVLNETKKIMQH
jgi:hypothetical protein